MHKPSSKLDYLKHKTRNPFSHLKIKLKQRMGWLGVPKIIVYNGFVSASTAFISGCLSEDKGLAKPDIKNSIWQNILSMIKRYSSDQIASAAIRVEIDNTKQETTTNENGLFSFTVASSGLKPKSHNQWIACKAVMKHSDIINHEKVYSWGQVLIPGTDADFGVISDIDDTIIVSHSTQFLRKLRLMLLRNSRTRKPFSGVDTFYRALSKGKNGNNSNPFFYISSSEWALYDLLDDFCTYNKLPKGVFLLRELNVSIWKLWKSGGGKHEHKFNKIDMLFKTYPNLKFVLIGDNGQQDTDIYARIARRYPNRVRSIYIRTVKKVKNHKMNSLTEELRKKNIPIIFTPTSAEAARHAAAHHLIAPALVQEIIAKVQCQ